MLYGTAQIADRRPQAARPVQYATSGPGHVHHALLPGGTLPKHLCVCVCVFLEGRWRGANFEDTITCIYLHYHSTAAAAGDARP